MLRNRKAQSTVEYVILVTAVLSIVIAFVLRNDSPFRQALNDTFQDGTDGMVNMADRLQASHSLSP